MTRRDRRGRRIGHNWWRELVMDQYGGAAADWERRRDEVAIGYDTEEREFAQANPRPTFKAFLLANAGQWR